MKRPQIPAFPFVAFLSTSLVLSACGAITGEKDAVDAGKNPGSNPVDASSGEATVELVGLDAGAADAPTDPAVQDSAAKDSAAKDSAAPDSSSRDAAGETSTADAGPKTDAAAGPTVFTSDNGTLARFEFNGDVLDTSGNARHATALGAATFASAKFGSGLVLAGDPQGFDWSTYASTLPSTFTIEVVYTSSNTSGYRKIFGANDTLDPGWYAIGTQVTSYPNAKFGTLAVNTLHYVAFVATSATMMDVWVDGALAGNTNIGFTAPPAQAIFFRDDTSTNRGEAMTGVVDAVRISSVARTSAEVGAVWAVVGP